MTQLHRSQPYPVSHLPAPQLPSTPTLTPMGQTIQPAAVFFEVVFGSAAASALTLPAPALPGWNLRLWPQARLGDATLEASPLQPSQPLGDLIAGLSAQGVDILGPVRLHR